MKSFNKISVVILVVASVLGLSVLVKAAATAVDLGTAEDFAVLAGAAVTDSNPAAGIDIIGDVGLSPTGGASITGLSCSQVTGTIYDTDAGYTGGFDANTTCLITDAGLLTTAKSDLSLAYNDADGQTPDTLIDDGDIGGGETLTPGVYSEDGTPDSLAVTGALILDGGGDPDAVFVFQTDSTLITSAGSEITLTNGAQACNVFWQVGSSATLGVGSIFVGTIMAAVSITDDGDSVIEGRLLADANDLDADSTGAVTLNNTTITVPTCATSATLTVTKVVVNDDDGTSAVGDFSLFLDGVVITSGVATTTSVGTFTISETGPAGYDATFTGDCAADGTIIMTDGNTYTCTLTNDDEEDDSGGGSSSGSSRRQTSASPTLRVIKRVVNGSVGTATSSDFTVFVREDGDDVSGSPAAGRESPGRSYTLSPGTYVVSETANPSYIQSFSGDCNANGVVTLSDGDDETCTITNTYVPVVPLLPNTGFPSEGKHIPWNGSLMGGAFIAALAVLGVSMYLRRGTHH
jgi:type VI secretion system secreted protein VgrG